MRDTMFDFFIDVFGTLVPNLLMTEPISYIFGISVGVFVVGLVGRLFHIAD